MTVVEQGLGHLSFLGTDTIGNAHSAVVDVADIALTVCLLFFLF